MRGTVIVMGFVSIWLIIFGIMNIRGKAADKAVKRHEEKISNIKAYLRFNGILYIASGIIGIILTLASYYITESSFIYIAFILLMVISALIQSLMAKYLK